MAGRGEEGGEGREAEVVGSRPRWRGLASGVAGKSRFVVLRGGGRGRGPTYGPMRVGGWAARAAGEIRRRRVGGGVRLGVGTDVRPSLSLTRGRGGRVEPGTGRWERGSAGFTVLPVRAARAPQVAIGEAAAPALAVLPTPRPLAHDPEWPYTCASLAEKTDRKKNGGEGGPDLCRKKKNHRYWREGY